MIVKSVEVKTTKSARLGPADILIALREYVEREAKQDIPQENVQICYEGTGTEICIFLTWTTKKK